MPKCKICGARIEDGISVCPSCGAKVISNGTGAAGTNAATAGVTRAAAAGTVRPRVSSTTQVIKTICPACGAEVVGEHRFCPQCGVNLKEAAEEKKAASQPKVRRCPSCGSVIEQNARFCPDCGVTLASVTGTARAAQKPSPSAGSTPKKSASTATASSVFSSSASAASAPVTHAAPVNTRKLRISLTPESLSETTAYFDTVQDACASSVMSDKGGTWTIAVEGDLTEDELDSIVSLAARTDGVKCLDFSSCANAQKLKQDSFFSGEVFVRCKELETARLADGSTRTNPNGAKKGKKKGRKGLAIATVIVVLVGIALYYVAGVQPRKSVLKSSDFVLVEGDANISSFYMCRHEVTQEEYQAVMGENPSYFKGSERPVEQVSWYDAVECCNKLSRAEGLTPCYRGSESSGYSCNFNANGYRLPTEVEWNYAAREGKSHSSYTYSGSNDIASVAWYWNNSGERTHDVMTKAPNRLGLYDMSGNVWEWCWDRDSSSSSYRVSRGGGWNYYDSFCAVSYRYSNYPNSRNYYRGFRLVRNAN